MPTPPNVVYLHSHDTGRCVQPYGHAVPTPRIQQLAEEGVLFRQAFCAAPTCSGSRAAFATGQYPHVNGMMGLAHRGFALHDMGRHLIHTLRRAGYTSTLIGEQHIAHDPWDIGFDHVRSPAELHHAVSVAPAAAEMLLDGPRQPFFLSVGFFETHRGYFEPASPALANWCPPPDGLPDTPETRRDMAGFRTSATALDRGVGIVLDALDAAHLADDTLVICTTDHGLANPGAKGTLSDRGLGVMLIVRGPGGFRGGRVVDALVQHLDVYPTLCELAGVDPPPGLHGRSLLPIVRGEVGRDPGGAVRRAHLPRRLRPPARGADEAPQVRAPVRRACRAGAGQRRRQPEQGRPGARRLGRAAARRGAALRPGARSRPRAATWRPTRATRRCSTTCAAGSTAGCEQTADPLLDGPVAAPSGAILNTPDQRSPDEPTFTVP